MKALGLSWFLLPALCLGCVNLDKPKVVAECSGSGICSDQILTYTGGVSGRELDSGSDVGGKADVALGSSDIANAGGSSDAREIVSSGGVTGSGGVIAPDASASAGGATGSGGATSMDAAIGIDLATRSGGDTSGGTSTGGAINTGGITGVGGGISVDGAISTGGVKGSGGGTGSSGATRSGGATGSGGTTSSGGATGAGGTTSASPVKLTGTAFGTSPPFKDNPTSTFDKAFDGNTNTFFDDSNATGGYTGIALATPVTVTRIRFYPRSNFNRRLPNGKFQCSATDQNSDYVDLYTIPPTPADAAWSDVPVTNSSVCRYLRYLGPTDSFTNIAEIEFWGLYP